MLASCYVRSYGAQKHHLMATLYHLLLDPRELITVLHACISFLKDQLATYEPIIKTVSKAKLVNAHRERLRLLQFLMGLLDDFESIHTVSFSIALLCSLLIK